MWAQLISARLKPGKETDLTTLFEQVQAAEQPGSGLLRSTFMRDQNDPSRVFMLVVFESEEHARAREQDQVDGLERHGGLEQLVDRGPHGHHPAGGHLEDGDGRPNALRITPGHGQA